MGPTSTIQYLITLSLSNNFKMKLAGLFAAIVAIAPVVVAADCRKGFMYCGRTLIGLGNYIPQILEALDDYGCDNPSGKNIDSTLFYCLGGPDGDIKVEKICKSCQDNGHGDDDTCSASGGHCDNPSGRLRHHSG